MQRLVKQVGIFAGCHQAAGRLGLLVECANLVELTLTVSQAFDLCIEVLRSLASFVEALHQLSLRGSHVVGGDTQVKGCVGRIGNGGGVSARGHVGQFGSG